MENNINKDIYIQILLNSYNEVNNKMILFQTSMVETEMELNKLRQENFELKEKIKNLSLENNEEVESCKINNVVDFPEKEKNDN